MSKSIKIISVLAMVLFIGVMAIGCQEDKVVLNVYNWGDYIDETVIGDFEKEYGIKVNYETYATNEDMYVKLKQGGTNYDVAFPSDYMIEKMIKEDMLAKIDMENISNYKYIDENFKNLAFDPNNSYSVPYMWGTVGILYNTKMIEGSVNSWDILWDDQYKKEILMLDSQRDSLAVALKKLGYSMNTRDESELQEAKQELIKQKPLVLAYVVDEVKGMMVGEEAALAVVWSGDAIAMMEENDNLNYVIPKEGTNLWFDNMVIPKDSQHKKEAELFIDFMTRPEISLKNTDYIGYSTTNSKTLTMLDEGMQNNKVAYPEQEELEGSEVFKDPGDFIKIYDRIWTEIKVQ